MSRIQWLLQWMDLLQNCKNKYNEETKMTDKEKLLMEIDQEELEIFDKFMSKNNEYKQTGHIIIPVATNSINYTSSITGYESSVEQETGNKNTHPYFTTTIKNGVGSQSYYGYESSTINPLTSKK